MITWVDLIGYLASALIVLSLAMRSVVRLRTVSLIGAVVFALYGILISAWPVIVSNVLIGLINIWYLRKEFRRSPEITAVPIERDAPFLIDFMSAHAPEIARSQPEYRPEPADTFVRLLTRDGFPAGIIIGEPKGHELQIKLDYVTPAYRDSQVARWLFADGKRVFTTAGFARLVAQAHTSAHRTYLEVVGFHREGPDYVLDL
ncbi:MAG: hypothetical protein ACK5LN_07825 [Propioniciclava sp.]